MASVGLYRCILGTGLPDPFDAAVNDFVIEDTGSAAGDHFADIVTALQHFYDAVPTSAATSISAYLAHDYAATAMQVEAYDITGHLDGSPHGAPVMLDSVSIGTHAVSHQSLPADLGVTLDVRSPYGTAVEFGTHARPRARRRGRILLGPLNVDALAAAFTTPALVKVQFGIDAVLAASALQAELSAIVPEVTQWSQWSRVDARVSRITHAGLRATFSTTRRRQDLGGYAATVDIV